MGYDLVVSGESGATSHGCVELSLDGQMSIAQVAREHALPILASFPEFWGDEFHVPVAQLQALLDELGQVDVLATGSPGARSATSKVRQIVAVAVHHRRPLSVVPD